MATLKKFVGEGGAGLDDSMGGHSNLYEALKAIAETLNDLVAQFNQLKADYDASTTPTTATDVTSTITVE